MSDEIGDECAVIAQRQRFESNICILSCLLLNLFIYLFKRHLANILHKWIHVLFTLTTRNWHAVINDNDNTVTRNNNDTIV